MTIRRAIKNRDLLKTERGNRTFWQRQFYMIPHLCPLFHLSMWAWMRAHPYATFADYLAAIRRAEELLAREQERLCQEMEPERTT